MVITYFGGPEVFPKRELPRPAPIPNEIVVKVQAASVSPADYKIRGSGRWAGWTEK